MQLDFTFSFDRYQLAKPEQSAPPVHNVGIKQMPAYDPDAEIASLALTVPAWRGSMERVRDTANFVAASESIKKKLLGQLSSLSDTICELEVILRGGRL